MRPPPGGAWRSADGRCRWRLWAPRAAAVDLVLLDVDRPPLRRPMDQPESGWFESELSGIREGQRYAFSLDGGPLRPDPWSFWQPEGVHAPSAVWSPAEFPWTDGDWRPPPRAQLVTYELHVGTFTPAGTFDALIPRLPELLELGVTAIELMPVNQFPGARGWGYDGAYWFAVQNSYGGPQGLQRLVNACHRQGLAVLLDVVYNHFGPEGCYLREFAPYFSSKYETPWGEAVNFDGPGAEEVRRFVRENVRWWLEAFRFDGLRLDAVHAMLDAGMPHVLAEIAQATRDVEQTDGRPRIVIAESILNDVRLLDAPEKGGDGLDAQWSDDFHHCVHALLTGERTGYYIDYNDPARQLATALEQMFVYDGAYSRFRRRPHGRPAGPHPGDRFVISIQTHDQVGNRARGERLSQLVSPQQLRLAAGLLLLAPQLPLLFMGEEYGETQPFLFFCDYGDPALQTAVREGRRREFAEFAWGGEVPDPCAPQTCEDSLLSWSWHDDPQRGGLRRLYCDLLTLRRTQPAMQDYVHRRAELRDVGGSPALVMTRGAADRPGHRLQTLFNLSGRSQSVVPPDWDEARLLLRSADYCESAPGVNVASPGASHGDALLGPWEFAVYGPPAILVDPEPGR